MGLINLTKAIQKKDKVILRTQLDEAFRGVDDVDRREQKIQRLLELLGGAKVRSCDFSDC